MLRIAITPVIPDLNNEVEEICAILDEGWDRVHLRHPDTTRENMVMILDTIPEEKRDRIVIHDHFDLSEVFPSIGLHLNRRSPKAPVSYNGSLSRSCHSVTEIKHYSGLSYVTLSPIFDSISKPDYSSTFSPEDLEQLQDIAIPVIALGGISPERIGALKRYNFSGFAMLGALPWGEGPKRMSRFVKQLKNY